MPKVYGAEKKRRDNYSEKQLFNSERLWLLKRPTTKLYNGQNQTRNNELYKTTESFTETFIKNIVKIICSFKQDE